jgi:LacI family transcriptional regulator
VKKPRQRIVLLADLEEHSAREACLGAAQFAAKSNLAFEPWSLRPLSGRALPRASDFRGVDGLLVTQGAARLVFGTKPRIGIPHVYLMGKSPTAKIPAVEFDERAIGRMGAEHLIHRGYANLVAIGFAKMEWSRLRVEGFRDECRRRGVKPLVHVLPEQSLSSIWRPNCLGKNQILRQLIAGLPRPCGLFAMNDVAACFIIEAARLDRIAIPAQLGVIGVDNDLIPNAAAGLSISSVELPFRALGWQAAEILDRLGRGVKVDPRTVLPPVRVVVRPSTDVFMVEDSLVRRAQARIEKIRGNPVRVADVARAAGTTTVTLGKRFREHLNLTPSEYILRRRLEYAKELLRKGDQNVEEVAAQCGFHSCSYFCQVFKRVTGATPGSFRRTPPSF